MEILLQGFQKMKSTFKLRLQHIPPSGQLPNTPPDNCRILLWTIAEKEVFFGLSSLVGIIGRVKEHFLMYIFYGFPFCKTTVSKDALWCSAF
jgi:hypothetical protein